MDIRKIELADFFDFCVMELKWSANRFHQMHSSLSSFSAWIENYFDEDYPTFRNLLPRIEKPIKENFYEKTDFCCVGDLWIFVCMFCRGGRAIIL